MAMTKAQWDALQKRLPKEDRAPYQEYLVSIGAMQSPATFTPSALAAKESGAIGATSIASQIATATAAAEAGIIANQQSPAAEKNPWDEPPYAAPQGKVWKWIGAKSVGRAGSGSWQLLNEAGSTTPASTSAWKGSGSTGDPLTYNGIPFTGTNNGARYINGVLQVDSTNNQGGITTGSGNANDPLLVNGKPFTGVLGGVNYTNGIAQKSDSFLSTTDIETKARRTAQQDFKAALGELGLGDLANEVDRMIRLDYTVSQIKMELPKTESYNLRFPGMKALRDAGSAINEATYISNEKGYLQTLRAYGLDTNVLGSRTALGTYIANMVAPREFEERVSMAVNRVNENPDVLETFKSFYPEVDKSGVVAYLLNPKAGMAIIKKQVRTSEIGAAAASAGFARDLMGISDIETLMPAVGETAYAGLRTEFLKARNLATAQRRLAQIENQSYSDLEAVGAIVGDDAAKLLASERRAAREAARFGARGGLTAGSLKETTAL